MLLRVGLVLLALVIAVSALSPVLGVPVPGTFLGRDADFAILALQMLSAAWAEGVFWPRWLMDTNYGLGGTTYYSYPPLAHWVAAAVAQVTGLGSAPASGLGSASAGRAGSVSVSGTVAAGTGAGRSRAVSAGGRGPTAWEASVTDMPTR